jgi:hypothetical protein
MSDLFNNVKPGDMVHYKTPQGQHGKGKVVLRYDTHVVVNRGKGQPQVVNDRNYVKHERGGKVIGALLSRLKEARVEGPYGGHPYDWDPELRKQIFAAAAKKVKQNGPKDNGRVYKPSKLGPPPRRGTTSEGANPPVKGLPDAPKHLHDHAAKESKKWHAAQHINYYNGQHHVEDWYDSDATVATYVAGKLREDAKDLEGKSSRVSKTKRLKKKLQEVSSGTLASYVSKSIADEKKQKHMADMAKNIHTPERSAYFVDKATKKAAKRHAGAKLAMKKIAKAYEETVTEATRSEYDANIHMSQGAKPTQKGHYLMRDGRKLSGPHTPEQAVKAYKGLASQGTDTKGVKIVHVKEGVETDVTSMILSEAKVKEAAQKAVALSKKAKGNKHVDTKPSLDIEDKGTGGPMETNQGDENAKI